MRSHRAASFALSLALFLTPALSGAQRPTPTRTAPSRRETAPPKPISISDVLVITGSELGTDAKIGPGEVSRINTAVVEAAIQADRFENVLNGQSQQALTEAIKGDRDPSKLIDAARRACGTNCQKVAKYLLIARITRVEEQHGPRRQVGDTVYTARLSVSIELSDVESGVTTQAANLEECSAQLCRLELSSDATLAGALSGVTKKLQSAMIENIVKMRPPRALAVVTQDSAGVASSIMLDAGSKQRLKKGARFRVVEMRSIEGETKLFPFPLGTLEVSEVMESTSLASPRDGGDKISDALKVATRKAALRLEASR